MSNEKFKVKFGLAVGDTQATIDGTTGNIITAGDAAINGSSITTTQTTFNVINTNATTVNAFGAATTLNIGNSGGTTNINGDLDVKGGDITSSTGELRITSGNTASNIVLTPSGTGDVLLTADTVQIGDPNATATLTTNGTGNLIINTNNGTNAGSITLANGTNGNITLAPNGTGNAALTLNNGGNLTNTRNYVFGAIRNATTAAAGDVWAVNVTGTVQPTRGISLDNSTDTSKLVATILRNYSDTAANRGRVIFERARGSAASPTAIQSGDNIGDMGFTGYTSTGWINDTLPVTPALVGINAAENWVSNTNLGTAFQVSLAPTATTVTSATNLVQTILSTPQGMVLRGDAFAAAQGKSTAFVAINCSVSGTTLTIGTVIAGAVGVGQVFNSSTSSIINGTYITANISGSGSGSTWTISTSQSTQSGLIILGNVGFIGGPGAGTSVDALQNLRLIKNNIQNSGGSNVIALSNTNATTTVNTTQLNLSNPVTQSTYNDASNIGLNAGNPVGATFNDRISQIRVTTANTSGSEASTITFNTGRYNTGTKNYSATQSGDTLGEFFFNGQYGTSTAFTTLGPSVRFQAKAAENFTATNSGGQFIINLDKIGGSTPYDGINISSANATIASDAITLTDSSGTNIVGSSKITYNRVYGQWQYDATITPAGANTAYAFPWQGGSAVTDYANIASATNTSRIQPNAVGFYNLQFSIQLENTDNAADHTAYIWWRKNGTDIAGSMGRVYVTKQHQTIAGWNNLVQATASTDYFELMYAVDDVRLIFPYYASTAFGPSTAATFLSLTPVGA